MIGDAILKRYTDVALKQLNAKYGGIHYPLSGGLRNIITQYDKTQSKIIDWYPLSGGLIKFIS